MAFVLPVAYLCPNRQLAVQADNRLRECGIPTALLIGKVNQWAPADRVRYSSAQAVAVSVYAHVFITNPGIDSGGTLMFDDAHAGEQPVASAWSVIIKRSEGAFQSVLSVLGDALDPVILASLREDDSVRCRLPRDLPRPTHIRVSPPPQGCRPSAARRKGHGVDR
jgi:hypothetical protein